MLERRKEGRKEMKARHPTPKLLYINPLTIPPHCTSIRPSSPCIIILHTHPKATPSTSLVICRIYRNLFAIFTRIAPPPSPPPGGPEFSIAHSALNHSNHRYTVTLRSKSSFFSAVLRCLSFTHWVVPKRRFGSTQA